MIQQAPLSIGLPELAMFLLANVILVWICAPKLVRDIRRWTSGEGGSGANS
jgi:hypothetical protein